MSQFTTGEVAKLCGVTVRTVQYYDSRNILTPSALTEGGRRLYSDEDVKKMKIICFLREIGLSIDGIGKLLQEDEPEKVIDVLLTQQEDLLRDEVQQKQAQLEKLEDMKKEIRKAEHFSIHSIGDIANTVENKKKMQAMHRNMLVPGGVVSLIEIGAILLGALKGIWWPMIIWAVVAVAYGVLSFRYYCKNIAFICPKCHEVFRAGHKEIFFSSHTPKTRKLTCPRCGQKSYCVETWGGDAQ